MAPKKAASTPKKAAAATQPQRTPAANNPETPSTSGKSVTARKRRKLAEDSDNGGSLGRKPAKGKQKSTRVRKADASDKYTQPGKASDTKSFFEETNSEARVAGYLGYKDIADFRKFLLSHFFLKFYLEYTGDWSNQLRKHSALDLIRDRHPQSGYDTFPLGEPNKYKDTPRSQRHYRLAHILVLMVYELGALGKTTTADEKSQESILSKLTAVRTACADAPTISGEVRLPEFKCASASEETALEPYNRAWALLKHFSHVTTQAIFATRFKDGWEHPTAIEESYVPAFMRSQTSGTLEIAPDPHTQTHEALSKFKFNIRIEWQNEKAPEDDRQLFDEYVEEKNYALQLPDVRQYCSADPRVYSQEQFRDSLRRLYKCEDLGLQLGLASMTVPGAEKVGKKTFNIFTCDWDLLRTTLKTRFEEQGVTNDVVVVITLRVLDKDNQEELYESTEPPPQLLGLFDANGESQVEDEEGDDEKEHEKFFQATSQHSKKPGKYETDPRKAFPSGAKGQAEFLAHYDGYDVTKAEERSKWQEKVLREVLEAAENPAPKIKKPQPTVGKHGPDSAVIQKLDAAAKAGELAAMSDQTGAEASNAQINYYSIQGAFTGTDAQTGPPLNPCLTVLGMKPVGGEQSISERTMYRCKLLEGSCTRTFYPYQVTGACFMLLRLMGTIPLPEEHAKDPEVQIALAKLRALGPRTYGCVLADATGLGKTVETLLAVAFIRLFADTCEAGRYKPFLFIVPANAISQWAEEIVKHWKCFALAISYAEEDLKTTFKDYAISASTIRELPKTRYGLKKTADSSRDYSYLFDGSQANAGTILVTSHDTQSSRFVFLHEINHPPKSYNPPEFDENGKETYEREAWTEYEWRTNMSDEFFLTVVDEAHEIKNPVTKNWASVYLAASTLTILITATPMQNNSADFIGLLMVLWQKLLEVIKEDDGLRHFAQRVGASWRKSFRGYSQALEEGDHANKRLVLLDPHRCASLLRTGNPQLIQENFHMIDDLLTLRRSPASRISVDSKGKKCLSLHKMMQPHTIKTISLTRGHDQELEYQYFHQDAAKRYEKQIKAAGQDARDEQPRLPAKIAPGGVSMTDRKKKKKQIAFPTVPLRDLDIANCSTYLARFNLQMRKAKSSTLVAQMNEWRKKGIDGEDFVKYTRRPGDRPVQTRADYIKLLCDSSPTLVAICRVIRGKVMKGEKLLITEQVPLNAWFWELAIKLLLVPAATMHSALDPNGRLQLTEDFSAVGGLMILILMYAVGGQAINLHRACARVFAATPAINYAKQVQAFGRVIRVNQEKAVEILMAFIKNSHSGFRFYKQSAKVIAELATRAHDPDVRELLVQLLQKHSDECEMAKETDEGKAILRFMKDNAMLGAQEPTSTMAGTYDENLEEFTSDTAGQGESRYPTRDRKAVSRFNPFEYDGVSGEFIQDKVQRATARAKGAASLLESGFETAEYFDEAPEDGSDGDYDDNAPEPESDNDGEDGDGESYREFTGRLTQQETQEVLYSEEMLQLMAMLKFGKGYTYQDDDLEDPKILRRALLLLYKARMGSNHFLDSSSIHIQYTKLPIDLNRELRDAFKKTDAKLMAENFGEVVVTKRKTDSRKAPRGIPKARKRDRFDAAPKSTATSGVVGPTTYNQTRLSNRIFDLHINDPNAMFTDVHAIEEFQQHGVSKITAEQLVNDVVFVDDPLQPLTIDEIAKRLLDASDAYFADCERAVRDLPAATEDDDE